MKGIALWFVELIKRILQLVKRGWFRIFRKETLQTQEEPQLTKQQRRAFLRRVRRLFFKKRGIKHFGTFAPISPFMVNGRPLPRRRRV